MKKQIALWMALLVIFNVPLALAEEATEEILTIHEEGTDAVEGVEGITETEATAESTGEGEQTSAETTVEESVADIEETAGVELVDAGITPDSPLYVVDTVVDDVQVALTFDEAERAELSVEVAEERLAETVEMAAEGNVEAAAEAQEEHEEALAEAEEAIEDLESDSSAENAEESLETVAELQNQVEGHAAKVAAVKDAILARKTAQGWDPEKLAHMEAVFAKIKAKAEATEAKTKEKREKVKVKYKALAGLTDAEVEEQVEQIEENAGLTRGRQERKSVERARGESRQEERTQAKGKATADSDPTEKGQGRGNRAR